MRDESWDGPRSHSFYVPHVISFLLSVYSPKIVHEEIFQFNLPRHDDVELSVEEAAFTCMAILIRE